MNGPWVKLESLGFSYPETETKVFSGLNLELEPGVWSLMGQNGTGKSTFMVLASGRFIPQEGTLRLFGKDTRILEDREKQTLASLVWQNMEFETEDKLGDLLDFVLSQGTLGDSVPGLMKDVTSVFELGNLLTRKTQNLAKGEMQRAVMAFSILYGSKAVLMDEPVFALEDHQKHKALEFLSGYARSSGRTFAYSVHELELGSKYADHIMLFHKDGYIQTGKTGEVFSVENIEKAYQVPFSLLHQKEQLYRDRLIKGPDLESAAQVLSRSQVN